MSAADLRRRTLLGATALAGLSTLGLLVHRSAEGRATIDAAAIAAQAQVGDLLFRGTRSLEGQVVRWIDGVSDFTHVGVLVQHPADHAWGVVHASSDTRQVSLDTLDTFTSVEGMATAGLFRWRGASPVARHTLQSEALGTVGRPFDGAFDSIDATQLYCTELIWMLARRRGWAGAPVLQSITTPLGGLRVITIDALLRDLPLQPVWHSEHGPSTRLQPG